jgi:dienelactone hydrolase
MSARKAICRGPVVIILAHALVVAPANAQDQLSIERISLSINSAFEQYARVIGELRLPNSNPEQLPAVVIVNSSPGFDGRGAFYADALNLAGIATLEIDMFQGKGLPASLRHNLPHVYQTLDYLSRHPRIDANRIGIMGFSWGGNVSVLASSDELARQYSRGELRFAAHLALYPACSKHYALVADKPGKWKGLKPTVYRRLTGGPVRILAAGKNDYDSRDREVCAKFIAALPAEVQRHFSLTVYPEATFGWDSRFGSTTYDANAKEGKGGIVEVIANAVVATQSQQSAVAYFSRYLEFDRTIDEPRDK